MVICAVEKIDILKAALVIVKEQLILAEETIEYTSWLTASIFSVLGVFTIFLSHQYQNHTSELKKLIWMMKNNVLKEDKDEFAQKVVDFEYFSKTPEVLLKAVKTSIIVLWIIVPVWFVGGLSKFFLIESTEGEGPSHYLSLFLIAVVTGLFIFFSIRLIIILSKLSAPEDKGTKILSILDLFNAKNLKEKNFHLSNIFKMNDINWNILISGEEPYSQIRLTSDYGIYNLSSLVFIEATGYEIYLSTPLTLHNGVKLPTEVDFYLDEQQCIDIQRFFLEVGIEQMRVSKIILVDGQLFYYQGLIEKQGDIFIIKTQKPKEHIELPTEIRNELLKLKPIVDIYRHT
jgi:hypothetical protein